MINIVWPTAAKVARTKKKLPKTAPLKPSSKSGRKITTMAPKNPMAVPKATFFLSFSLKKKREPIKRKIGPEVAIIGALMDGARSRPKKKKLILIVIPKRESKSNGPQSLRLILRLPEIKGNRISAPIKKRRKAKVKGSILVRDHLKMGEAAPQIMLAKIKAKIAFRWLLKFIGQWILRPQ